MFKVIPAYLYQGAQEIVVLSKNDINDAKEELFKEVILAVSKEKIKEWNEELELLGEDEDDF
jgi:hypothetical protein